MRFSKMGAVWQKTKKEPSVVCSLPVVWKELPYLANSVASHGILCRESWVEAIAERSIDWPWRDHQRTSFLCIPQFERLAIHFVWWDLPLITPCAAKNMAAVKAPEKMTFCPEFKYAKEVVILTDDFSYSRRCLSYSAISCFSLLKCYWVTLWILKSHGHKEDNSTAP